MNHAFILLVVGALVGCGSDSKEKKPPEVIEEVVKKPELVLVTPAENNEASRRLIGYVGLENELRQTVAAKPDSFYLNHYLQGYGSSYLDDLSALMGVHEGKGQTASFRNGTPTPVNALLYELVIAGVADDLVRHCQEPVPFSANAPEYRPDLLTQVRDLCHTDAYTSDQAAQLYQSLVHYASPVVEREEWQKYFATEYQAESPTLRTRDMIYAALFNPYYLLTN